MAKRLLPEDDMPDEKVPRLGTPYNIQESSETMPRKYGYEERKFKVQFDKDYMGKRLVDVQQQLRGMFEETVQRGLRDYGHEDRASIVIQHNDLRRDIVIHMRKNKDISAEAIMNRVEKVLQSDDELSIDNSFQINFGLLRTDKGGGRTALTNADIKDKNNSLIRKKCITVIPELPDDQTCSARAVVVCMAKLNNDPHLKHLQERSRVHSRGPNTQRGRALHLLRQVGLPDNKQVDIRDFHKFENHLDVQIVVLDVAVGYNIIYAGETRERKIFLLKEGEHFHSITNIHALFAAREVCTICLKFYGRSNVHHCELKCHICNEEGCEWKEQKHCTDCNRICRNEDCYARHKQSEIYKAGERKGKEKLSRCDQYYKCKDCGKLLDSQKRSKAEHVCHEWLCQCCQKYVVGEHLCYLRGAQPKRTTGKFIFFDFEATQDEIWQCDEGYTCKKKDNCKDVII